MSTNQIRTSSPLHDKPPWPKPPSLPTWTDFLVSTSSPLLSMVCSLRGRLLQCPCTESTSKASPDTSDEIQSPQRSCPPAPAGPATFTEPDSATALPRPSLFFQQICLRAPERLGLSTWKLCPPDLPTAASLSSFICLLSRPLRLAHQRDRPHPQPGSSSAPSSCHLFSIDTRYQLTSHIHLFREPHPVIFRVKVNNLN